MSEVDVGTMTVEIEPSWQYFIKFCCLETSASRGRQSDKLVFDTEVCMKQRYRIEFLHAIKKLHPLTFTDTWQTFVETKQRTWVQWGSKGCISAVATAAWKTSHVHDDHGQLLHHEMEDISISSSTQISRLQSGSCVQSFSALEMMMAMFEYCKVCTRWIPWYSQRSRNNTVWKFVRICWTGMRQKVTVSWIASLPVMRHSVTTTNQSQNGSP